MWVTELVSNTNRGNENVKVLEWLVGWRVRHDFVWALILFWCRICQLTLVLLSGWTFLMLTYGGVISVTAHQSPYGEIPYEWWFMAVPAILMTFNDLRNFFKSHSWKGDKVAFVVRR